jgi:hypothetical protein
LCGRQVEDRDVHERLALSRGQGLKCSHDIQLTDAWCRCNLRGTGATEKRSPAQTSPPAHGEVVEHATKPRVLSLYDRDLWPSAPGPKEDFLHEILCFLAIVGEEVSLS